MDTFVTPMLEHLHLISTRVACIFSSRAATPIYAEKATTFRDIFWVILRKEGEMRKNGKKWQTTGDCLVSPIDFKDCAAHDLFFDGAGGYLQM